MVVPAQYLMLTIVVIISLEVSQLLWQRRVLLVVLLLVLPIFGRELIMLCAEEIETVNAEDPEQQMSILISPREEADNSCAARRTVILGPGRDCTVQRSLIKLKRFGTLCLFGVCIARSLKFKEIR